MNIKNLDKNKNFLKSSFTILSLVHVVKEKEKIFLRISNPFTFVIHPNPPHHHNKTSKPTLFLTKFFFFWWWHMGNECKHTPMAKGNAHKG